MNAQYAQNTCSTLAENFDFRKATPEDAPFLIETILGAERGDGGFVSYTRIFDLNEAELRQILMQIIIEDLDGQDLTFNGYLVAEQNGQFAGAFCAWIEAYEPPVPSGILKISLLREFIPAEKFLAARPRLEIASEIAIPRTTGALQLENLYVQPPFRGKGLGRALTKKCIETHFVNHPDLNLVQVTTLDTFLTAQKIYTQCGFTPVKVAHAQNPAILALYPGSSRILFEKRFDESVAK